VTFLFVLIICFHQNAWLQITNNIIFMLLKYQGILLQYQQLKMDDADRFTMRLSSKRHVLKKKIGLEASGHFNFLKNISGIIFLWWIYC